MLFVTTYRRRGNGGWMTTERRCISWREVLAVVHHWPGARVRVAEAGGAVFVEIGI